MKTKTFDSVAPTQPFYIDGGAPSSLAGTARAGARQSTLLLLPLPLSSALRDLSFGLRSGARCGWALLPPPDIPRENKILKTMVAGSAGFPHASKTRAGEPPPSLFYPCPAFAPLARPRVGSACPAEAWASRKELFERPAHLPRLVAERAKTRAFLARTTRRGEGAEPPRYLNRPEPTPPAIACNDGRFV